eukprot:3425783-Prymnesium_polylepis.1
MVHDASVTFEDIIASTPQSLKDRQVYNELAVMLLTDEHRRISLHHIASKMVAPEATVRGGQNRLSSFVSRSYVEATWPARMRSLAHRARRQRHASVIDTELLPSILMHTAKTGGPNDSSSMHDRPLNDMQVGAPRIAVRFHFSNSRTV